MNPNFLFKIKKERQSDSEFVSTIFHKIFAELTYLQNTAYKFHLDDCNIYRILPVV